MTAGAEAAPGGAVNLNPEAPPSDTGEALGLPASSLTLTFGVGPGFFDKLGLGAQRPAGLAPLPTFQRDQIDPALSGGDLCVQACADDPQVAVHAIRNLARMGFGATAVRWSQLGFGRTSSTSTSQATPRNLFGFKDGTRNLKAEDTDLLRDHVWVQPGDGPAWLEGGSYLVARRIRMHIEVWDRTSLAEQESIIGRNKGEGAPRGKSKEFDEPNLAARPPSRRTRTSASRPRRTWAGCGSCGAATTSSTAATGRATSTRACSSWPYMRNPQTQFVPMQRALAGKDRLMEYIEHTGSAVFAIPRGLGPTGLLGPGRSSRP